MIYIAMCDDMKHSLDLNKKLMDQFLRTHNKLAHIEVYRSSEMLTHDIIEGKEYDLYILDIEMPGVDGLSLANTIRAHCKNALIIFISSYENYAIQSMEYEVFRYIPKNQVEAQLDSILQKAFKKIEDQQNQAYIIKTVTRYERIMYQDILWLSKDAKNTMIHTKMGETFERKSLKEIADELTSTAFCYIDRNCIVNLMNVSKIIGYDVYMVNGTILQISKKRITELKAQLNQYLGSQI